jgi:hypothetical protein
VAALLEDALSVEESCACSTPLALKKIKTIANGNRLQ